MQFQLNADQTKRLNKWLKEIYAEAIKKQKKEYLAPSIFIQDCWDSGYPYTGAIGGGLTYTFSPTGLGDVVKVKEAITGQEIDLTEYDSW